MLSGLPFVGKYSGPNGPIFRFHDLFGGVQHVPCCCNSFRVEPLHIQKLLARQNVTEGLPSEAFWSGIDILLPFLCSS